MTTVQEQLEEHLRPLGGPFLFVGAGLTRRYAGLPNWEGLLRHFAQWTPQPYEYYFGLASGELPRVASLIADDFYNVWWSDPQFAESREANGTSVRNGSSALKIEVARHVVDWLASSSVPAELRHEFELLQKANVDGVITTNYDGLLNLVYPEFELFIGQDELLFSDTQGIAEIYAIHGSATAPESLVLTRSDYDEFQDRNAYLAAKLLTIFVEHPVLFLGYSLGDSNIRTILQSLVRGLKTANVGKLARRLIFVEWEADSTSSISETVIVVDNVTIPITRVVVPDFIEVFGALAARERAMPAKWLRILKEQVYEIVRTNDPKGRLVAYADIDSDNAKNISVVFGVGAKMGVFGIVGLNRDDLMVDVLGNPDGGYPAEEIVEKVLSKMNTRTWCPIYKYLREAGLLNRDGSFVDPTKVPAKVILRAADNDAVLQTQIPGHNRVSMTRLRAKHDDRWFFNEALNMQAHTKDADGLREYLIEKESLRNDDNWWSAQYAKLVVAYDAMVYRTT